MRFSMTSRTATFLAKCICVYHRYLFWTEWGQYPRIERSRLDGSERLVLVNVSISWPNGISIDYKVCIKVCVYVLSVMWHVQNQITRSDMQEGLLYWCDARTDKIERINLETGENRELVLSSHNMDMFAVSVFEDYIYWSDRCKCSIFLFTQCFFYSFVLFFLLGVLGIGDSVCFVFLTGHMPTAPSREEIRTMPRIWFIWEQASVFSSKILKSSIVPGSKVCTLLNKPLYRDDKCKGEIIYHILGSLAYNQGQMEFINVLCRRFYLCFFIASKIKVCVHNLSVYCAYL